MALRDITNLKLGTSRPVPKPKPYGRPTDTRNATKPTATRSAARNASKPIKARTQPSLSPQSKARRAALEKFVEPKDPARRLNWAHLERALREAIAGHDDSAYKTTNIKVLANKIERNIADYCNYDLNKKLYEQHVKSRLDILRQGNRKLIVDIMTHKKRPWDFARMVYQKNIVSEYTIKNFDKGQPLSTQVWPTPEIAREEMTKLMAELSLNERGHGKRKKVEPEVKVTKVSKPKVTSLWICSKCGEVPHDHFATNYVQCMTCKLVTKVSLSDQSDTAYAFQVARIRSQLASRVLT